jgi:hypothetical protein
LVREEFHARDLAGRVLEVVDVTRVALLDDLLPPAGQQLA